MHTVVNYNLHSFAFPKKFTLYIYIQNTFRPIGVFFRGMGQTTHCVLHVSCLKLSLREWDFSSQAGPLDRSLSPVSLA